MTENIEHDGATCDVCGIRDEECDEAGRTWDGSCGNCSEHCLGYEGCP